jgi:hypothetical protein
VVVDLVVVLSHLLGFGADRRHPWAEPPPIRAAEAFELIKRRLRSSSRALDVSL